MTIFTAMAQKGGQGEGGDKMNYLELVEFYMDEYGMDEETACRLADMDTNPEYSADDYDA